MSAHETILSKQEKKWLMERRVTRLSDNKEVQIYPMGAERYLSSILLNNKRRYNIKACIEGKNVLVIPGYGNSGFLFSQAGAKSVTVYDKDPVTIAWIKAFKKYYHYSGQQVSNNNPYPSIGELLSALTCWYPPLLTLPSGKYKHIIFWITDPNLLRRVYIHYMLDLVCHAINSKIQDNFELESDLQFYAGTIGKIPTNHQKTFDTAFVPYLLGVRNGIENEKDIVNFIEKLFDHIPNGHVLVNPSRNTKEFYITGKQYFITTGYSNIQSIPELSAYVIAEDKYWFRTQGLAVLSMQPPLLDNG